MEAWMKNTTDSLEEFFSIFSEKLITLGEVAGEPWKSFPFDVEAKRKPLIQLPEERSYMFCLNTDVNNFTYVINEHGHVITLRYEPASIDLLDMAGLLYTTIEHTTRRMDHYDGLCGSKDSFVLLVFKLFDGPVLHWVHPVLKVGTNCYLGIYVTCPEPGKFKYSWKKI